MDGGEIGQLELLTIISRDPALPRQRHTAPNSTHSSPQSLVEKRRGPMAPMV